MNKWQNIKEGQRIICLRCWRSQKVCFCSQLKALQVKQKYIILQHPKERRNPVGTGRTTHLMLPHSKIIDGVEFASDSRVQNILADSTLFPAILYPGSDSLNLETDGKIIKEIIGQKKLALFIVDGTWAQAKKMMKLSYNLHRLPKFSFTPPFLSQYKIRHQPLPECLSTIEATSVVLNLLKNLSLETSEIEPQLLLQAFKFLVDQQLEFKKNPDLNRHKQNHILRNKKTLTPPPPKKRTSPRPIIYLQKNFANQINNLTCKM